MRPEWVWIRRANLFALLLSLLSFSFAFCANVREMCAKAGKGAIDTSAQNWCLAGIITIQTLASIDKRQIWTLAFNNNRQI